MSSLDSIRQLLTNPADRQAAINAAKVWQSSGLSWVSRGTKLMAQAFLTIEPDTRPAQIIPLGLHGRNSEDWPARDFELIKGFPVVKMMGHTHLGVYERIRRENPNILIITRMYDTGLQNTYFNRGRFPSPLEFTVVAGWKADMIHEACGCDMFEVHNEPNHPQGYEGWGISNEHAESFNAWFYEVCDRLRDKYPWIKLGFPGLAIPHRDLEWLDICRPSIERADWLGCHAYWQTVPGEEDNHLSPDWGLRFIYYHGKYPGKDIHITEVGNSSDPAVSEALLLRQVEEYQAKCAEFNYLHSISFFIMSSPDPAWAGFAWRTEGGRFKPVVSMRDAV